jgi:hypothetical protein
MTDHRTKVLTELTTATSLDGVELATAKLRALEEFGVESPEQGADPGLEPPC